MRTKTLKFINALCFICVFLSLLSCGEDIQLELKDYEYVSDEVSIIEINIQKVKGTSKVATAINNKITNFVCKSFNLDVSETNFTDINGCAAQFNESYTTFKAQLNANLFGELPVWEVFVDGELGYQDDTLISFAMSSSINTGAVKPITKIEFLNFNNTTGEILNYKDLVEDETGLKTIIKSYLERELMATTYNINQFKTANGQLKNPDHFGYSESGLVVIYNAPNGDFLECAIPFSKANDYLKY